MVVIVLDKLTNDLLDKAREDYPSYIKITADLQQGLVAVGGEYHADAERILVEKYASKRSDIWGGGYDLRSKKFETNALINIKPEVNDSTEILTPSVRRRFLDLVKIRLFKFREDLGS